MLFPGSAAALCSGAALPLLGFLGENSSFRMCFAAEVSPSWEMSARGIGIPVSGVFRGFQAVVHSAFRAICQREAEQNGCSWTLQMQFRQTLIFELFHGSCEFLGICESALTCRG